MSAEDRAEEERRRAVVRAKMVEDDARRPVIYDPPSKRRGRYPGPGNSETIMRNRVLRAATFGLQHDGRYA